MTMTNMGEVDDDPHLQLGDTEFIKLAFSKDSEVRTSLQGSGPVKLTFDRISYVLWKHQTVLD